MTGPYAEAAAAYWSAGWRGVLPLPARRKGPPPGGYTGWAGIDPSRADVQTWVDGPEGAGNIGLRLPDGVYGLDVDAYGGKGGRAAMAELWDRLGPLPGTWTVTSRGDGVSGIRLFRASLEPGRRWRDEPAGHGAGIEAIHFGHRYAVVWPSVHPETGREYVWQRSPVAADPGEVPRVNDLPDLPAAWVEALSEPGEVASGEAAGHADTLAAVQAMPTGEACDRMRDAATRGLARLREARDGAALHPAGRDATHELCRLGHEGHAGARRALAEHFGAFVDVRVRRDGPQRAAEAEWWRLVRGAVGKLAGEPRGSCDCALLRGEGLLFDAPIGTALESTGGDVPASESPGVGGGEGLAEAMLARLLTAAQLRDLPPPAPLVDGLLYLDSAAWLIARSSSYKTFVALDLSGHIASGKPWQGRQVHRGDVVYLVAEGVGGMGPRIRAWEQRNGRMDGVHFLPMPVQVKREDHWAAWIEACRRLDPRMIVLDTQARITVGLDENDNSAMGEYVEAVEKLRRATRACVLTVHHLGRSGQDARGASAIDAAQDTELRLTRTADRRVVLQIDKSRNTADDVRVDLELFVTELDGGGTSLVVGTPLTGPAGEPDWRANLTLNQSVLVQVMADIFPELGATKAELKSEVRKRPIHTVDTAGAPLVLDPMGESSYRKAFDALVAAGRLVRVEGSQRYVLGDADYTATREVSES